MFCLWLLELLLLLACLCTLYVPRIYGRKIVVLNQVAETHPVFLFVITNVPKDIVQANEGIRTPAALLNPITIVVDAAKICFLLLQW